MKHFQKMKILNVKMKFKLIIFKKLTIKNVHNKIYKMNSQKIKQKIILYKKFKIKI